MFEHPHFIHDRYVQETALLTADIERRRAIRERLDAEAPAAAPRRGLAALLRRRVAPRESLPSGCVAQPSVR